MERDSRVEVKWGPVADDDLQVIEIPDGNTVSVLYHITEGIEAAAQTAAQSRYKLAEKAQAGKGKGKKSANNVMGGAEFFFDNGAYRLALLTKMIRAWTFEDKAGRPIPVKPEAIARLPVHTREVIMEGIDASNPVTSDEEDEDLESASAPSLPETEAALKD